MEAKEELKTLTCKNYWCFEAVVVFEYENEGECVECVINK